MNDQKIEAAACSGYAGPVCSARDYFAGQVLNAYIQIGGLRALESIANQDGEAAQKNINNMARLCFLFADALMDHRGQQNKAVSGAAEPRNAQRAGSDIV